MTFHLSINLPVSDVRRAREFYCRLFEVAPGAGDLTFGDGVTLNIVDESGWNHRRADRGYVRGRTPRLELRVDDVAAWVARAAAAGARVHCCLTPGADGVLRRIANDKEPVLYAHVINPFGHLWAFAKVTD